MAPKPYDDDIVQDLGLNHNHNFMMDKSPAKPQRRISSQDLHSGTSPIPIKPPSAKSLSSGASGVNKKKKKKKKKTSDGLATSHHSVGDTSSKRKKKRGDKKKETKKKKKKKDALSQSDHTPLSKSMSRDESEEINLPLNDIQETSPHPIAKSRRRRRAIPSRNGSLKRNNSLPTLTGSDSDGDSTLQGSWQGSDNDEGAAAVNHQSFPNLSDFDRGDEPRRHISANKKGAVTSEMEAFLDQLIIDASKPKSPITSIRKKARGRSRKQQKSDKKIDDDDDEDEYPVRPKSEPFLDCGDNDNDDDQNGKPDRPQSISDADRVVSLSIAGEEKTFTLSGSDIGVIEAFLQTKDTRSLDGSKKKKRTTSESRAAKRAELFQGDRLSKSDRSTGSGDKRRSLSTSRRTSQEPPLTNTRRSFSNSRRREGRASTGMVRSRSNSTPKRVEDFGVLAGVVQKRRSLSASRRSGKGDDLLHSERIDHGRRLSAQSKDGNNVSRFDRQQQRFGHLQRMSENGEKQRPRSLSMDRPTNKKWQEIHDLRMSLLELDTISDEGSYSLTTRSISRRWSLSDSMSSSHHLQRLNNSKHRAKKTEESGFFKKDVDANGPFNVVRAPRGRRKSDSADRVLCMPDSSDDEELFIEDEPKYKANKRRSDRRKRQTRAGGKRPTNSSNDLPDEDDEIYDSPGVLRPFTRPKVKLMQNDEEASDIEQSMKSQTLAHLMSPALLGGEPMPHSPQTKQRGSKVSTPNGAHIYTLDLGEARWTTTPTQHLKGKDRPRGDPLDLQLPFADDNGKRNSGTLKTEKLGLVEPSTFRNSVIRSKKRISKKGPEEGDILVCDEDNGTVVSDITEAVILDSSFRSTLSTSIRSTDHDDYDEPLRDKWQPKIERIKESNSQSDLNVSADMSAASGPSDKKEAATDQEIASQTTPGGAKRFTWMKKLPSFKKK